MVKFFEDYPEFNGYDQPPYLIRMRDTKHVPNNRLNRTLLRSALKADKARPKTLLDSGDTWSTAAVESIDWEPYKSPYISVEEEAYAKRSKKPK